ncbi:hypothetical protein GCK72_021973 [Caenorhabditis remanei]|uniref:F-box domain-containing protein n=1 Tax=Caenorhabditis remanei TaxID=31234 RepID=A0A6A5GL58_CAERE|nr:hypothetical protein GCK72_021973 [Caenorhabditis remanei]KAF1755404.1 hypothetical protein GCK72_021973 [Caenorhabditis remanei]
MPCWNYLPAEIKQHVVKKLDFMSRHSLRYTSHLDRLIVDSTPVQLPRVRFGYKDGKYLIVIYTGVEKFLRLEFEIDPSIDKNFVIVHKSENSCNPKKVTTKFVPFLTVWHCAIMHLKSLLAHKSIKINSMEWDVSPEDLKNFLAMRVIELLDGERFRTNEMVMRVHVWGELCKFWNNVCNKEELKVIRQLGLFIDKRGLVPVMAHQLDQYADGKLYSSIFMRMHLSLEDFQETYNNFIEAVKNYIDDLQVVTFKFFDKKNSHIIDEGGELGNVVVHPHKSECGDFIYNVNKKYEQHLDHLKTIKCDLGPFCKRCSDPFEYWYYQNFPRRVLHEPLWTDFIFNIDEEKTQEKLRKNVLQHEIMMENIQKGNKKKTPEIPSWGFKMIPSDGLVYPVYPVNRGGLVKKNKKRKYKLREKEITRKSGEDVVMDEREVDKMEAIEDLDNMFDSEDNVDISEDETASEEPAPENIPESDSSHVRDECLTDSEEKPEEIQTAEPNITLRNLQCIVLTVLFPISVSIILYFVLF